MTIPNANAGANPTPKTFISLPTTHALSGTGTFFAPATAIVSYLWELVEKPAGSAAVLTSTTAQNPTLNSIDTPGTYLLFLRVTDDNPGGAEQSQGDKLKAPASAFISVRAELPNGLVKPAPSERDHADVLLEWAVDIDANQTTMDGHVADVTDPHNTLSVAGTVKVSDAPAGAGEVLVSTSTTTAGWGASSQPDATTGVKGIITLAEAPVSAGTPKAVTRDRSKLEALINDSYTPLGWVPGEVLVQVATGPHNRCHKVWYLDEDVRLKTWDLAFLSGGTIAGGGYTIRLVRMSPAQFLADTVSDVLDTVIIAAPGSDQAPLNSPANSVDLAITGGNYLGVYVISAPSAGAGGHGLNVTVNLEKRW